MLELFIKNCNLTVQPNFTNRKIIFFDFQKVCLTIKIKSFFIGGGINVRKKNFDCLIEFPKNAYVQKITDNDGIMFVEGWFLLKREGMYYKYLFEICKENEVPIRLTVEYFGDSSEIKMHIPSLLDVIEENKKEKTIDLDLDVHVDLVDDSSKKIINKRNNCMPSLFGFVHIQKIDVCKKEEINKKYKLTGAGIDAITSFLIDSHKLHCQYKNDVFLFCSTFTSNIWPTFRMAEPAIIKKSYETAVKYTRNLKDVLVEKDYWCFVVNDNADHWVFVIIYKPFDPNETAPIMFVADSLYFVSSDAGDEVENENDEIELDSDSDSDSDSNSNSDDDDDESDGDEDDESESKSKSDGDSYNKKLTRLYVSVCILICFTVNELEMNEMTLIPMYMKDRGFVNLKCFMQNDNVSCGYHALMNLSTFITSPLSRAHTINTQSLYFPINSSSSTDSIPIQVTSLFNTVIREKLQQKIKKKK